MSISIDQLEAEIARRQQQQSESTVSNMSLADIDKEIARRAQTQPDQVRQALVDNPITAGAAEFGSAVTRGFAETADFFTTKPINAALELSGFDARVPEINKALSPATTGNFVEEGLTKDVLRKSGELIGPGVAVGGALRTAAQTIPAIQPTIQTAKQGIIKQLGASTAGQDVALNALSGAGGEVGKASDVPGGEIIGSLAAPITGASVKPMLNTVIKSGRAGIEALIRPLAGISDDGSATLLAEAMVREGLTPDDIVRRMNELGPEAIPADLGTNFARLLRTASNKIPRIEGTASEVFKIRQSGQGDRLLSALDDATGTASLTVDDEIARISAILKPKITQLYKEAGTDNIILTPRLQNLMSGKNSLGKAQQQAQSVLADRAAAGDKLTNLDLIDATKQVLDDKIGVAVRKGANNRARDLIRLKNVMIDEADTAIPVYREARDLFAGKSALENAAAIGEQFIKLKPRDMRELTKTFGQSEKRMFKLGAKQSVLNKIDDLQTNADAVKRLFGKNGDVKKLRFLFDDERQFRQFSNTLKREADFITTRRAAQANSTTAKQLSDDQSSVEALGNAAQAISNPLATASTLTRLLSKFGKGRNDADYIRALEEVGDILLVKGFNPAAIQALLRKGSQKQIEARLREALKKQTRPEFMNISTLGGAQALDRVQQQEQ